MVIISDSTAVREKACDLDAERFPFGEIRMKEIEISERMNVTFKNVVSVRFDSFDIKKVEESATKFDSYIKE